MARAYSSPQRAKISLIVDSKGTGKADKEIIVADKWEPYPPEMNTHGVDALGVAIDKDGAVYFGLGCKSYVNAYMIDKEGKSHYDLKSERGTILKVAPDFSKREIVCTGIRFPVGLAFNRHGDLFATDQEGATWLPTETLWTNCCTSSPAGIMAFRRGIRSTCRMSSMSRAPSITVRSTSRPAV